MCGWESLAGRPWEGHAARSTTSQHLQAHHGGRPARPTLPPSTTLASMDVKDSLVMLSPFVALRVNSAKHLFACRARPFAALRVTLFGNVA